MELKKLYESINVSQLDETLYPCYGCEHRKYCDVHDHFDGNEMNCDRFRENSGIWLAHIIELSQL